MGWRHAAALVRLSDLRSANASALTGLERDDVMVASSAACGQSRRQRHDKPPNRQSLFEHA